MPRKKDDIEKELEIEKAIAEEFRENDDIVDYINGKTIDSLKKRYESADVDEEILNEAFEPAPKSGLFRKKKPGGYGYYYSPQALNNPNEIKNINDSPLSKLFDSAQSEYDSDNVSFSDINLDEPANAEDAPEQFNEELNIVKSEKSLLSLHQPAEELESDELEETPAPKKRGRPKKVTEPIEEEIPEDEIKPAPKKRGRPKKVVEPVEEEIHEEEIKPAPKKRGRPKKVAEPIEEEIPEDEIKPAPKKRGRPKKVAEPVEEETDPNETITIKKIYNTNTKVIYFDENADDGIKRTEEDEVNSAFGDETKKPKRRGLFSFFHRKKKS